MAKKAPETAPASARIHIPKFGKRKRAVLWIGPPLCGKDSQTDRYEELGLPVLKMGPALKTLAKENPASPASAAISKSQLVDSGTVNWAAKLWTLKNITEPLVHLNGMPRTIPQLEIVSFLEEHGFDSTVIWFTTPREECMARPVRPGREAEDTPANRAKRIGIYERETLPILPLLEKLFGICEANYNLLKVDNSGLRKHETGEIILEYLQLPITIAHLFPEAFPRNGVCHEMRSSIPAV